MSLFKSNLTFFALCMGSVMTLHLSLAWADLDAPAAPSDAGSAMYTLGDICQRLDDGTAGSKRSSAFAEPATGPTNTSCSLDEVMQKAPAVNANAAIAGEVASGRTFWGLKNGAWGLQTGTVAAGANVTGANGILSMTIPGGLYSGSKTATATDSSLIAANIKSGATIFGVAGDSNVVDTSNGDAAAGDIVKDKKAYVDGQLVSGSLESRSLSAANDMVAAGIYGATTLSTVDTDLASGNIKKGVTIFGVSGDNNVVDTSSGDATDNDIAAGKKAWVDGSEVTGTLVLAPVAATGQTKCYDSSGGEITCTGTGQDGEFQTGKKVTGDRFTDNNDGTVTDNLTSLIWLKDPTCNNGRNWNTALSIANSLSEGSCNLSDGSTAGDWHLPNIGELASLIDYSQTSSLLPSGHPFNVEGIPHFWSSTTYPPNTNQTWMLSFNNTGGVGTYSKTYGSYIWPVRKGY